jgi:hypothetical protein
MQEPVASMMALLTDHLKQQTRPVKCIIPESIVVTDNHDILKKQLQSRQTEGMLTGIFGATVHVFVFDYKCKNAGTGSLQI